jgi:hypothetical protein
MTTPQFIAHSRFSFALLRWASLLALAALPFTFSQGALQTGALVGAFFVAAGWLGSLLVYWRTQHPFWGAAGFMVMIFGSRWSGVHRAEVSMSEFFQWICLVVLFAGAPLLLFRQRLLRWAGLDESAAAV